MARRVTRAEAELILSKVCELAAAGAHPDVIAEKVDRSPMYIRRLLWQHRPRVNARKEHYQNMAVRTVERQVRINNERLAEKIGTAVENYDPTAEMLTNREAIALHKITMSHDPDTAKKPSGPLIQQNHNVFQVTPEMQQNALETARAVADSNQKRIAPPSHPNDPSVPKP